MITWTFNRKLFMQLSDVLDISYAKIAERCGLRQQVISRYVTGEIELSLQVLIKICNALRMPIYYFVSENDNHVIPNRESATLPLGLWQPITWNHQVVELTFGDGEGKIYWKDVAAVMGVSSQKPHERFLLRRRFPIEGFLTTCTHYQISPFKFLIDPNRETDKQGSIRLGASAPRPSKGRCLTNTNHADYVTLTRKLDELNATVLDLTKKFDSLLAAHKTLISRVQMNIQDVNSSHLGLNDHINIATEGNETQKTAKADK